MVALEGGEEGKCGVAGVGEAAPRPLKGVYAEDWLLKKPNVWEQRVLVV